jgi:hypothetical protein
MGADEIAAFLREMIADYDPVDLDSFYWYERAAEALPARLDPDFLEPFLAGLPIEQRVFVIAQLAAFGHREVTANARALRDELQTRPAALLTIAIALMDCGDAEGETILRALYRTDATAAPADRRRCDLPVAKALRRLGTPAALSLRFRLITGDVAAATLDRDALAEGLRAAAAPIDDDEEFWFPYLAPRLPRGALPAAFIDDVLAALPVYAQVGLLQLLARIGRTEVIAAAARLTTLADIEAFQLLGLGEVLVRCQDARGAVVLEALYRRSIDRRSFDKDTVPCDWITDDVLREEIGTFAALSVRLGLLRLIPRIASGRPP